MKIDKIIAQVWAAVNAKIDNISLDSLIEGGGSGPLSITNGGTGATTAAIALANLNGLSLSGGTLSGDLVIEKSYPSLYFKSGYGDGGKILWHAPSTSNGILVLISQNNIASTEDGSFMLSIHTPQDASLHNALQLTYITSSNWDTYDVLHTGSDKVTANNSLYSMSLGVGTSIPNGSDLNNYDEIGNYVCSSSDTAVSLSNCPVSDAFTLKVFSGTGYSSCSAGSTWRYPYQILIPYRSELGIWTRDGSTGNGTTINWWNWHQLPVATNGVISGYTVQGAVYN